MKKFFKMIPVAALAVAASCAAVACGEPEAPATEVEQHVHSYSEEWSWDNVYHWREAECVHEDKQADKGLHSYTVTVVEPTTVSPGYTRYTCVCGKTYRDNFTPQLEDTEHEHDWIKFKAKEPTCLEAGWEAYELCTICGEYKEGKELKLIPATGHEFNSSVWVGSDDYRKHYHPSTCIHAGLKKDEQIHNLGHTGVCECGYQTSTNLIFEEVENGYKVVGLGETAKQTGRVYIPTTYNGKEVSIDDYAFEGGKNDGDKIKDLQLGSGVKVGIGAFKGCTNIKIVHVRDKVPQAAFSGCTGLKEVVFELDTLAEIGDCAFQDCTSLETIGVAKWNPDGTAVTEGVDDQDFPISATYDDRNFPAKLTKIGSQAFMNTGVTAIALPAELEKLDSNTFMNCTKLASVTFNDKLATIYTQAFYGCTALKSVELPASLDLIGQSAFEASGLTSVVVPKTVKHVSSYVFRNCKDLETAEVRAVGPYIIGGSMFAGCYKLAELVIPYVGEGAMWKPEEEGGYSFNENRPFGYMFGTAPYGAGEYAAVACRQLGKDYYIPAKLKKVTVLGLNEALTLGNSDGKIVYEPVQTGSGDNKKNVDIGIIAEEAFANCTMIEEIVLGEDVSTIYYDAFKGCENLKKITIEGNNDGWKGYASPSYIGQDNKAQDVTVGTPEENKAALVDSGYIWYRDTEA